MSRRRPVRGRRRWPGCRALAAGLVVTLTMMTIVALAARTTAADADDAERQRASPPPPPPAPKHQQPQPLHPHPPSPGQLPLRVRANTAVWRIALHHARDCRAAGARSFPRADGGGGGGSDGGGGGDGGSGGGGGSAPEGGGGGAPCVNVYGVDVARRRHGTVTWFSMSTEARALREVALSPPLLLPAAPGNGSGGSGGGASANAGDAAAAARRARRATAYTMPWRGPQLLAADASTGRARWTWPSAGWWPWQTLGWAAGLPAGSSFSLALDRTSAAAAAGAAAAVPGAAAGAPASAALPSRVFVTSAHPPRVFALRAPRSGPGPAGGGAARNGGGRGGGAVGAGGRAAQEADVRSASLAWEWAPRASTEPPERARGARGEWEARRAMVTDAAGPALVAPAAPSADPAAAAAAAAQEDDAVAPRAGGDGPAAPGDDGAPRALLFVSLSVPTGYGGSQGWIAALNAAHGVSGGGRGRRRHGKGMAAAAAEGAGNTAGSAQKEGDAPLLAWESPRVPCALSQVEAHASWALLVAQAQQQQQQQRQLQQPRGYGCKRAGRRAYGGDEDDWGAGPAAEAGGGDRQRRQASLAADVVLARCTHGAPSVFYAFDAGTGDLLWSREEEGGDGGGAPAGVGAPEGGDGDGAGAVGRAPLAASYRGALLLPSPPPSVAPATNFGAAPRVLTAVDVRSGEELWHLGLPLPPPPPPPPSSSSSSSSSSLSPSLSLLPRSSGANDAPPRRASPQAQHECTAPTVYYDGDVLPADSAAAAARLGPGAGGTVLLGCACAGKADPLGGAAASASASASAARVACAYALDLRTGRQRWARALPSSSVEAGDATAWPPGARAWGHAPLVLRPSAASAPAPPPAPSSLLAAADPPPAPRVAVFVAGRTVHAVATADGAALWDVPLAEGDAVAAWMQPSALWGPSATRGAGGGGGAAGAASLVARRRATPAAPAASASASSASVSPSAGAVVLVGADSSGASPNPRPRTSVYAFDAASGARLWAREFEGWPQPRARPGAATFAAEAGVAAPLRIVLRPPPPPPPSAAASPAASLPLVLLELCRPASAAGGPGAPKCCLRGIGAVSGAVRWGFCVEARAGRPATRPAAERAIRVLWWLGALGVGGLALSAVAVGIRGAAVEEQAVGGRGEQGGGGGGSSGGAAAGTAAAAAAGGSRPRSSSSRPSSSSRAGGSVRGGKAAPAALAAAAATAQAVQAFDPFADGSYGERLLDSEEAEEGEGEAAAAARAMAAAVAGTAARAGAGAGAAAAPR